MNAVTKIFGHRPNVGLLIIRIVVGLAFVAHGVDKLNTGVDNVANFFGSNGIPAALLMAWIVTLVEIIAGAALVVGYATRLAALLLAVVMIVAIITVKFNAGFFGGYELDLVILGSLLALLFSGAGRFAIEKDHVVTQPTETTL